MIFIKHLQAGILQELQIYWNFPKRLFAFAVPFLFYFTISIIYHKYDMTKEYFVRYFIRIRYVEIIAMISIFWVILSEMIHNRETKIKKFIMINGMSQFADLTRIFITNSFLTIPVFKF